MSLPASCIIREGTLQTQAAKSSGSEPDLPRAPTEATGNYGKVDGADVLSGGGLGAFEPMGKVERVEVSQIEVEGQPFEKAVRIEVKEDSQQIWDVQLAAKSASAVERGDVLLATFYFRTEWAPQESGEGKTEFVFELAKDPWTKSVSYPVAAARDWKKIYVPFVAEQTYQAGEAQMIFRLGYGRQTLDIGGVTVENFGKQLALADLPQTKLTYGGMEEDAAWRSEAQERIEKHRKAPLQVTVVDAKGRPLPGASVEVEQAEHQFHFGTCVASSLINGSNEQYKQVMLQDGLFNVATLENNLKWVALDGDWGNSYSLEGANKAIDWLTQNDVPVRGHVLIWPGWRNLPKRLRAMEDRPDELRSEVRDHIVELATKMRGKVVHWDVMNEPFDNHDLMDILGEEEMVKWFELAKKAEPEAQLFINDYAILSGGGGTTPHRDHYEKTIRYLLDKGAPVEGIGMQGHFGTSLTSPDDLLKILDRFAEFGKPIYITEYDIVVDDEELAASYTRDFYTTLFSHPAVTGVVMWGYWDPAHWKKNAPMYRRDWSLKPSGQVYRDLVTKEWRTDVEGETDKQGKYSIRAFHGTHQVRVEAGGKQQVKEVTVDKAGTTITIALK